MEIRLKIWVRGITACQPLSSGWMKSFKSTCFHRDGRTHFFVEASIHNTYFEIPHNSTNGAVPPATHIRKQHSLVTSVVVAVAVAVAVAAVVVVVVVVVVAFRPLL